MTAAEEETIDLGSKKVISEVDPPNPLQKLIQGFCSPNKISTSRSFDNEDDGYNIYTPDLTPQKIAAKKIREEEEEDTKDAATVESSVVTEEKPDPTTTEPEPEPEPEPKPESESETETESSGTDKNTEQEGKPEEDVSKKVIANRRKTGIENFIVACIVLLSTLLALEKLGLTTSMIGSSASNGGSGSSSWIHVVDKSTIDETLTKETAKIQIDDEGDDEGDDDDESDDEGEANDNSDETTADEL